MFSDGMNQAAARMDIVGSNLPPTGRLNFGQFAIRSSSICSKLKFDFEEADQEEEVTSEFETTNEFGSSGISDHSLLLSPSETPSTPFRLAEFFFNY